MRTNNPYAFFGNGNSSDDDNSELTHGALLVLFVVLAAYVIFGAFAEHKQIKFIHETGFGIILGMLIGVVFVFADEQYYHSSMEFSSDFFMLFILPPIIFAGGYNLKKRRFFQNFFYITLFGLFGTLVNFGVVSSLTVAINEFGWIRRYSDIGQKITLTTGEILTYSATICATDSVAALAMIKPDKYPKLFSVIFGEGMVNDSVSIILFQAIHDLFPIGTGQNKPFYWYTFFEVLGDFLANALGAIGFGLITGLGGAFITKQLRFISHNPVLETALIFFLGFIAYMCAELLEWSGVIAILVSGISMSHYLQYNLSPKGRMVSGETYSFISIVAEAFLYVYLGISVWENKGYTPTGESDPKLVAWSWTFFLLQMLIIFIARIASVFGTSGIAYLFKGKRFRLNVYELMMICYAGVIRGAIAFALIQTLPKTGVDGETLEQVQVLQSTTLFVVIFTTVVLGGTMPLFINWNMKKMSQLNSSNLEASKLTQEDEDDKQKSLLNKPEGESLQDRKYKSGTQKGWKKWDEKYLKRWFIFDYENRKEAIKREKLRRKQKEENPEAFMQESMVDEMEAQSRRESIIAGDQQETQEIQQQTVECENLSRAQSNVQGQESEYQDENQVQQRGQARTIQF